ncbi:MAG TPA: flagellar biosynthesis protein FliQ [Phycisphaerae bacterium]|nr:flagellar biosynthesis protein FliQ [Phycisphaerae bacterium]HNU46169.1 flagellar biosynthesis protein FliQ [Phycisphaerae bacterium]
MEISAAMELGRTAFWMALSTSAPILIIGLVVGLAIAVFQSVTQLQEQTLSFAPKIVAMVVAGAIFTPWIAERMVAFAQQMLGSLPW